MADTPKYVEFQAFLTNIKTIPSRNVRQLIFEIDRSQISPKVRHDLDDLMEKESMLCIGLAPVEKAKEIAEERERSPAEKFYLGFLKDNKKFWEYLEEVGEHPTITKINDFSDAKDVFRRTVGVESLTDCFPGTFDSYIKSFNNWLKEGS